MHWYGAQGSGAGSTVTANVGTANTVITNLVNPTLGTHHINCLHSGGGAHTLHPASATSKYFHICSILIYTHPQLICFLHNQSLPKIGYPA